MGASWARTTATQGASGTMYSKGGGSLMMTTMRRPNGGITNTTTQGPNVAGSDNINARVEPAQDN